MAPGGLPELLAVLCIVCSSRFSVSAQTLGSGINTAVSAEALTNGVAQILMAPPNQGSLQEPNGGLVPLFGASIGWSPTTTGQPRTAIGSPGAINSAGTATVYGAVYVYDSEQFSFTLLQTLLPPSQPGSPGLETFSRFSATIAMSQNSVQSPVVSGTNLFVGQPFSTLQARSDETVYFYSATVQTTDMTRSRYLPVQALRLTTASSCRFGSSLALAPDDATLIVGAPGTLVCSS